MRIDVYLAENKLAESRSKARAMIEGGMVTVNGKKCSKPALEVNEGDDVQITAQLRFVSRGGEKLLGALEGFKLDVSNAVCADLGASTGGFTDCLLKHGAKKVYAIDCGSDQLYPSLKEDARVVSLEKTNARTLTAEMLGEKCDIVVMDVSFISQTLLYDAVKSILFSGGKLISLIKPQFEASRSALGGGGILRDRKEHIKVLEKVIKTAEGNGLYLSGIINSPIKGGDGNREYLALFTFSPDHVPAERVIMDKKSLLELL